MKTEDWLIVSLLAMLPLSLLCSWAAYRLGRVQERLEWLERELVERGA